MTLRIPMTIKFLDNAGMPRIVTVSNEAIFRISDNPNDYLLYSHLHHHLRKDGEPAQEQFFTTSNKELVERCIDVIYEHLKKGESFCDLVNIQKEFQMDS